LELGGVLVVGKGEIMLVNGILVAASWLTRIDRPGPKKFKPNGRVRAISRQYPATVGQAKSVDKQWTDTAPASNGGMLLVFATPDPGFSIVEPLNHPVLAIN
jgi:hypothetical protein